MRPRFRIGVLVIAVISLGLEGCTPDPPDRCQGLSGPDEGGRTIAVLVGVTAEDRNPQAAADRRDALNKVLDAGFCLKARLLFDVIGPGPGSEAFSEFALVAEGNNSDTRDQDERNQRKELWKKLQPVLDRTLPGAPDVLSAARALASHLDADTARRGLDVVVMSSMLNATAELPLTDPVTLARPPETVVGELERSGRLMPCPSWRVYTVGPGRTATRSLDGVEGDQLQRLWYTLFERCGGERWRWEPQLARFPNDRQPQPPPTTTITTVPPPTVPCPSHAKLEVPNALLFDSGRWDLRSDAGSTLEAIRTFVEANLSACPGWVVEIAGHTDDVGSDADNDLLSQRRSDSVLAWVVAHSPAGLRVRAVGRGERDPRCGEPTDVCRQQNRRVSVSLEAS